jgi:D-mannonate dehydratase
MSQELSQEINFKTLDIPIPEIIKTYTIEKQKEIFEYLNEMDNLNKQGYKIAFYHLETSFDICKSNGYQKWILKKNLNK